MAKKRPEPAVKRSAPQAETRSDRQLVAMNATMIARIAMITTKAGHGACRRNQIGDHAQLSSICSAQNNIAPPAGSRRNVRAPAMPINT